MTTISQKAVDFIIACEVSSQATYTKRYEHPQWPGGESGVTIGIGYDLGQQTTAHFKTDWAGILDDAAIATLTPACGVKEQAAKTLAAEMKSVIVTWEQAHANFQERTLPKYVASTVAALPNTDLLSGDSLGALVSLVYNRGAGGFDHSGDRYTEMRQIKALMGTKDFAAIPAQFRAMTRLWPDLPGLVKRRNDEADLFEQGLQPASGA